MKIFKLSSFLILLATLFFSCQKEYSLETPKMPAGTWQFNDSTKLYTGNIDSAYIETTGTIKTLRLIGKSADGSQTFNMHLYATDSFTVGAYKASLFQSDFEYFTQAKTLYQADQFVGEFIVNITAIGNSNVTGIFSGVASDSSNNIKTLKLGKFTSKINLSTNGTGGGGTGVAVGTLGASAGTCTPVSPSGTYTQGVALTSSNTVQVTVTVTTPGTYTISTNTVNGVSFSKSGIFTATGVQNVILNGTGTPTNSGAQTFAVSFGTSTCNFSLTFGAGAAQATGTLGGSPGNCTPVTPAGTYTQGIALTSSNTVTVQVNVTTVGAYTISTTTVNGVTFSATGTFTTTGVQNVVLAGTGTPTNSGSQTFAVTFGSSTCNFSITFAAGTVLDYFPTTVGSNWAYGKQGGTPSDSFLLKVISYMLSANGNTYSTFTEDRIPPSGSPDSLYYRKTVAGGQGAYYEYFNTQNFFGFDSPGTPPTVEYIFLKDSTTVPAGSTWQSPQFSGMQGGTNYTLFIKMTLLAKAVPVTLGSFSFADVMKVKYEYFVTLLPGTPIATEERWFARGVGLIYDSDDFNSPEVYTVGRYDIK
ncbi:MAG: hypothetical protein M3004_01975 [Bacteroidota bacterium]|nr:hypothetical protein [Bacteroidota bacterium]